MYKPLFPVVENKYEGERGLVCGRSLNRTVEINDIIQKRETERWSTYKSEYDNVILTYLEDSNKQKLADKFKKEDTIKS